MTYIRRFSILTIVFVMSAWSYGHSQTLSLFNIDPSGFPTVQANILAAGADGLSIRDIDPSELAIIENGTINGQNITIDCPPRPVTTDPLSIVLVIDKSLSMAQSADGGVMTRMELIQQGALEFVDALTVVPQTMLAIVAFDIEATLWLDFTPDKNEMRNAINDLTPFHLVGTNYDDAFLNPAIGAAEMLNRRPNNIKRVVVFLTDGQPVPNIVSRSDIMKEIGSDGVNAQVFSIAFQTFMHNDLKRISDDTKGKWYEQVTELEEIKGIYRQIAEIIQGVDPCVVTWQSDVGCGEENRFRTADVTFLRNGSMSSEDYVAPSSSVAKLEQSAFTVGFGSPAIGAPVQKSVIFTARNAAFTINSAIVAPDETYFRILDWRKNEDLPQPGSIPSGLVLEPEDSLIVNIEFTQLDELDFRLASFRITSSPCDPTPVSLWGGGRPEDELQIEVSTDKDVYTACDSIAISWSGVPVHRPVEISYSDDDGATWNVIEAAFSGASTYNWHPPAVGDLYRFRVVADANFPDWEWVQTDGGSGTDILRDMAMDLDGASYVIGEATGSVTIAGSDIPGGENFIAKYDDKGAGLWGLQATADLKRCAIDQGSGSIYAVSDKVVQKFTDGAGNGQRIFNRPVLNTVTEDFSDVAVSNGGQLYTVGTFVERRTIDGNTTDVYTMFLESRNIVTGRVNNPDNDRLEIRDADAKLITVDASGDIVVAGIIRGSAPFLGIQREQGRFLAKFDPAFNLKWVINIAGTDNIASIVMRDITTSVGDNAIVIAGSFSDDISFDGETIDRRGETDGFLVKFSSDGDFQWVQQVASRGGDFFDECSGVAIDVGGSIFVSGTFEGDQVSFESGPNVEFIPLRESNEADNADLLVVKYNDQGDFQWVVTGGGRRDELSVAVGVDASSKARVAAYYDSPDAQFNQWTPTNFGVEDAFLGSIVNLLGGQDETDAPAQVLAPVIAVTPEPPAIVNAPAGQGPGVTMDAQLCNNGTAPLLINEDVVIDGVNAGDFILGVNLNGAVLAPGECVELEIVFLPSAVGNRSAKLTVEGECADPLEVDLQGVGLDPCLADFPTEPVTITAAVGTSETAIFPAPFINRSDVGPLDLALFIDGPDKDLFEIVQPSPTSQPAVKDDPIVVEVRFTPPGPGGGQYNATLDYGVDCLIARTPLVGIATASPPIGSVSGHTFGTINCPGETETFALEANNSGGTDLEILDVTFETPDPSFGVNVWTPIVESGIPGSIEVIFQPQGAAGPKQVTLLVATNDPDNPLIPVVVSGDYDPVGWTLSAPEVDFGNIADSKFPVEQTIDVTNDMLNTDLDVGAHLNPGLGMTLVSVVPQIIGPQQTAVVTIRFERPALPGSSVNTLLEIEATPDCAGVIQIPAKGASVQTFAEPTSRLYILDPHDRGERIAIAVELEDDQDPNILPGSDFTISVTFENGSLFLPKAVSNGVIDTQYVRPLAGGNGFERVVVVSGITPELQDGIQETLYTLTEIIGDAMLGNARETDVNLQVNEWADVSVASGPVATVQLENVCEIGANGGRLLLANAEFGVQNIVPNPPIDEAEVIVLPVEVGTHSVALYNVHGQRVFIEEWTESLHAHGSQTGRSKSVRIKTAQLSSGAYQVIFSTPTQVVKRSLVIAK